MISLKNYIQLPILRALCEHLVLNGKCLPSVGIYFFIDYSPSMQNTSTNVTHTRIFLSIYKYYNIFYNVSSQAICPDFKPFMNSLIMANRTHFKHIFFIALKPNGHDGICPKYDATYYGKYMAENAASTDQSAMTKVETVSTAFSVTIKNLLGKQDNLIKKQEPYLFSSIFLSRTPVPSHQKREIIATDFFEVPDVLSRMIVTPASFSQNDKRFLKENRGVQCSAMAIVALTRALTLPVEYWTPKILDKILIAGDKLYTDSRRGKKINHAYLELEEVASKYHIDSIEYAVTFEYDKYVGDDQFSLSSLILAMNKFFAESTEGILLAKKYFVTLFKRTLANGGIVYYLFDSHGRGPMGLNYDGYDNGKRTAVLVKFSSLSDMAEVVIRNFATVPNEKSVDQFRNSIYGKDFQIHKLNVIISSSQQISHYNAAIPVRSHQPIPTMIHREVSQFSRPHASSPNTADPIRLLPQIPNSHTSLIPKTAPGVPQTIRLLPTPPSQNHFNSNNIVRENSRGSASIPVNSLQALSPLPIQPIPPASANPDGLLRRAPHIRRPLPRTPSTTESIHNAPNYLSPPGPPPKPPVTPARRDYYTPSKNNMNFPTPQLVPPVG